MSLKKVGALIKQARTDAGLTQEQLARKVKDCSAADLGKAERGEKELTQDQLKQIAKATGVTQKSLLDAAKGTSSAKPAAKKPASSSSASTGSLTANEKKLISLYRKADAKTKKATMELLEEGAEETGNILTSLLGGSGNAGNILGSLLGGSGSGSNSGSGVGNLLGTLLGGSGSSSGSSSAGGNLLNTLLGGAASVLGGKREMPEGEEGDKGDKSPELIKEL